MITYNDVLNKYKKKDGAKSMLTPLVEENKILLIHGESGAGKTVFAIKHLNGYDIMPLLFDLDDNEMEELNSLDCKCDMIDGYALIDDMLADEDTDEVFEAMTGKVVIIDTWQLFHSAVGGEEVAHALMVKMTEMGITVIVAAHTTSYAGKEDRADMQESVYRHIKGRLYIRKTTKKYEVQYHLLVEKIRGYKGSKMELIRIDESPDKPKKKGDK